MPLPARAIAAIVALVLAGACGGGPKSAAVAPVTPDGTYEIRGTIVAVDAPRRLVEINHEAIPGFMPAMTMPYEVADAGLLQGLAPGDRVRGTLRVDSRGYIITSLARV